MFESANLTISGNVVADPRVGGDPHNPDRATFRVVSNRRRRDTQTGEWVDAGIFAVNVVCWRKLARGVAHSLHRGDPVFVTGRIATREYTDDDGNRRWMTEVTADFVGLDLGQGMTSRFFKFNKLDAADAGSAIAGNHAGDGEPVAGMTQSEAGGASAGAGDTADDGFATPAADVFEEPSTDMATL